MMEKLKEKINEYVDKNRQLILDTQNYIWKNPETGYREVKTSAYLENIFEKLGYSIVKAGNIPGFYTVLDTGRSGPEVLILGELDSLICREHPECDKEKRERSIVAVTAPRRRRLSALRRHLPKRICSIRFAEGYAFVQYLRRSL